MAWSSNISKPVFRRTAGCGIGRARPRAGFPRLSYRRRHERRLRPGPVVLFRPGNVLVWSRAAGSGTPLRGTYRNDGFRERTSLKPTFTRRWLTFFCIALSHLFRCWGKRQARSRVGGGLESHSARRLDWVRCSSHTPNGEPSVRASDTALPIRPALRPMSL